tara:strand:+ start:1525 stop:1953 length:429 start_codon:yes stop_codon:yes gene_type:complete
MICRLQTTRDYADSFKALSVWVSKGAILTYAMDGPQLVGTILAASAHLSDHAIDYCAQLGLDPTRIAFRSTIFVDPAYGKQGLSRELSAKSLRALKAAGKTHVIGFGYETQAIYDWAAKVPENRITDVVDYTGRFVMLRDLG